MLKQISHILISGFISFVLSGCTVISIENADKIETQFYPGFVIVEVVDAHDNVAIKSRGVGTYFSGEGITFGYFDDHRVYLNDLSKCITVFFEAQTEPLMCKSQ